MSIKIKISGHKFLSYQPMPHPQIPTDEAHIPLTFVLVIVKYQNRYLWQFNPERQNWEIAGGGIEAGEHPDETAIREVWEETSQKLINLQCKGLFKLQLLPDNRLEFGLLYTGEIETLLPLVKNSEAERLHLWDLQETIEGGVSDISYRMFDFAELDTPYLAD